MIGIRDELLRAMTTLGLASKIEEISVSVDTMCHEMRITVFLSEDWTFTPRVPVEVSSSDVAKVIDVATTLLQWVESRCEPDCGICAVKRKTIEELERKFSTTEHEPAWK